MRITFDSQNWQPVVRPDKFPKDPRNADFVKINKALKGGRIKGYIVDTVATLEGIRREDRGRYFSRRVPHPGLADVLCDRLKEAKELGFQLLHAPRIGLVIPPELNNLYLNETDDQHLRERQERALSAIRCIEGRGVGKAQAEQIGKRIASRLKLSGPWHEFLDRAADEKENDLIAECIGEWADEDALAAHVAYEHDFFCSDDFGKGASKVLGNSIMTPSNRAWLSGKLRIQFTSLEQLAAKL